VEVERSCQDEILNHLTIKRIILRSLACPVKTFRVIVVMDGGHVVLVREGVLSVVVIPMCWVEGVASPEGGVLTYRQGAEEDPAAVAEDRVHCGAVHNLDPSTLFTGYHLL